MQGTSDKFDLRIVNEQNSNGAYLEFNHIIDPSVPVVYHLKSTNIFNNVSPTGSTVTQTCYQGGAGGTCDYTFVRETAYSEATNITTDTINARIYWDTDVSCTKTQDCNLNTFFVYDCGTDSGCAAPTTICTGVEDTTCSGTTDPCYSDVSCTPASVTQMAQNDYLGFRVRILSKQENVYFRYNSSARDSWFNVTEQTVDAGGGNNDPVISWVNNSVVENPIEGSIKTISINFNVTDLDGASDLNDTSAKIYLNKTGEPSRFNASCTPSGNSGNTETYTCAIDMQFYDLSGDWTINASIQDNSHSYAENITETFTYNLLSSIKLNPIFLNFSSTLIKGAILNATNNPLLLNNTGNDNFTTIKIKALDLIGITNNNYYISATNFTASVSDVFGDQLINNTNVTISTATLNRGYNETEQIYVWVNLTKYVIPQEYNTSTLGEWIIYLE